MNRRTAGSVIALLAVVGAVVAVTLSRRGSGEEPTSAAPAAPTGSVSELVLFVVETPTEPLVAVVASTSDGESRAVVIPANLPITIPGQGEGLVSDVAGSGRPGQVAISNMLGLWVDHHAVTDLSHLSAVIDRAGGIDIGGIRRTGSETIASLEQGSGGSAVWETVVGGLLASGAVWEPGDFLDIDAVDKVSAILGAGGRPVVELLPTRVSAGGQEEPDNERIGPVLTTVLGAPSRPIVPVTVLNGSGAPGVGEAVAERIVPEGYRVVVSDNASTFDNEETLIVVATESERQLAEHVRDLLGVGQVVVSGPPSGIAQVTIVVGKDFGTG